MSLRKPCFYAMLAAMLTFATAEKLNCHLKESDPPHTRASPQLLAGRFRAKNEMAPANFLPVQSKNARSLGVGKVLVAARNLGDPPFVKSVILLVRYDAEGVLGLILNRRTDIPISRALESVKGAKDRSDPVYIGGPVETPAVFALFQSPGKIENAEPIFNGVYLITAKPLFEQTLSARPVPGVFHVYLGYAGWNQAQLQKEVELGAWFIFPAEASTVFNAHPETLWQDMIRKTELQLALTKPGSLAGIGHLSCKREFTSIRAEGHLYGTFRQSHCNQLSKFQTDPSKTLVALNAKAVRSCSTLSLASQRLALGIRLFQTHNHHRYRL